MNIYNEICKYTSIFYHILHLLCNIVNILYRINFPRAPLLPRRAPSDSADNLHLGARVQSSSEDFSSPTPAPGSRQILLTIFIWVPVCIKRE